MFSLIFVRLEIKLRAFPVNTRAHILMHIFHFDFTGSSFYNLLDLSLGAVNIFYLS